MHPLSQFSTGNERRTACLDFPYAKRNDPTRVFDQATALGRPGGFFDQLPGVMKQAPSMLMGKRRSTS